MNFDFQPIGDTQLLIGKGAGSFFAKARKGPNSKIHREWIRDVITMFGRKTELPTSQACQLVQSGDFSRAQQLHTRHVKKTPERITVIVEGGVQSVPNPKWERYNALSHMQPKDHLDFMRTSFGWALSLRHPEQRVPHGKPSDTDMSKIAKRIIMHEDETRAAHNRRVAMALALAMNPTQENMSALGRSFGL